MEDSAIRWADRGCDGRYVLSLAIDNGNTLLIWTQYHLMRTPVPILGILVNNGRAFLLAWKLGGVSSAASIGILIMRF